MKIKTTIVSLLLVLTACGRVDPYVDKFQAQIAFGDSRSHVIDVMGPPTSIGRIEVPLVRVEQLAWKTVSGRVYLVHTAMDRVVAKSIIE